MIHQKVHNVFQNAQLEATTGTSVTFILTLLAGGTFFPNTGQKTSIHPYIYLSIGYTAYPCRVKRGWSQSRLTEREGGTGYHRVDELTNKANTLKFTSMDDLQSLLHLLCTQKDHRPGEPIDKLLGSTPLSRKHGV